MSNKSTLSATLDICLMKHGYWILCNPPEAPLYKCSVCEKTPTVRKTNYCSNCGAKMDMNGNYILNMEDNYELYD